MHFSAGDLADISESTCVTAAGTRALYTSWFRNVNRIPSRGMARAACGNYSLINIKNFCLFVCMHSILPRGRDRLLLQSKKPRLALWTSSILDYHCPPHAD